LTFSRSRPFSFLITITTVTIMVITTGISIMEGPPSPIIMRPVSFLTGSETIELPRAAR